LNVESFLILLLGFLQLIGLLRISVESDSEVREEIGREILSTVDDDLEDSVNRGVIQERLYFGDEMFVEKAS